MTKAVVLLSGGLDSLTCLCWAKAQHKACYALSFDYGQRHHVELDAAKRIGERYGIPVKVLAMSCLSEIGGSALTDYTIAVPDYEPHGEIPVTYVPARNLIFLSLATAYAETLQADEIVIGVSSVDYSGYPDCRPEFIESFQKTACLGTKQGVEGHAVKLLTPLIGLSKAQTIELGQKVGADYALSVSCYQANKLGEACGHCDSCVLRKRGFQEAGVSDPTRYQALP